MAGNGTVEQSDEMMVHGTHTHTLSLSHEGLSSLLLSDGLRSTHPAF